MAKNPLHGRARAHGHLLQHHAFPSGPHVMLSNPRRARATARAYDGETVTVVADVIARSGEWLCLAQPDGEDVWNVWLHRSACTPL